MENESNKLKDDLDESSTLDDIIYEHFLDMEHYQYDFKQHYNLSFILGPKIRTTQRDFTTTMSILHYRHLPNKALMCGYCPPKSDEEMDFLNELLKGEFKVRRINTGIVSNATDPENVTETYSYPSTQCLKYPYNKTMKKP